MNMLLLNVSDVTVGWHGGGVGWGRRMKEP